MQHHGRKPLTGFCSRDRRSFGTRQHILGPEVHLLSPIVEKNRSNTHLWTPELHYIDSKYYLYYSVFNNESKPGFDICVATSLDMSDHSWTDPGSIGVPPPSAPQTWAAIDQNILTDESDPHTEDPAYQIVWGSFNAALYGMALEASKPLKVDSLQQPQPLIQDEPVAVPDSHGSTVVVAQREASNGKLARVQDNGRGATTTSTPGAAAVQLRRNTHT